MVFLLCACGARSEIHGTGILDASTEDADFVRCEDAGACNTSDSYCSIFTGDAGTTYTCAPLPSNCHACSCVTLPKLDLVCVCTSDTDQIKISCNAI